MNSIPYCVVGHVKRICVIVKFNVDAQFELLGIQLFAIHK